MTAPQNHLYPYSRFLAETVAYSNRYPYRSALDAFSFVFHAWQYSAIDGFMDPEHLLDVARDYLNKRHTILTRIDEGSWRERAM